MNDSFADKPPAFLSTGAVARLLNLKPDEVRAMVDSGRLPLPQRMAMGRRTERVYSHEWVVLADEAVNSNRLEGLESWLPPEDVSQFVIRLDQAVWTLDEAIERLAALDALWRACMDALGVDPAEVPELQVRRLSAGSPLDILLWIGGGLATGAGVWLMRTAINAPEKIVSLIPRAIAEWHNSWADASDAKARHIVSDRHLDDIRAAAEDVRGPAEASETRTAVTGAAVKQAELEVLAAEQKLDSEPQVESDNAEIEGGGV